jgi:hypothetical protein
VWAYARSVQSASMGDRQGSLRRVWFQFDLRSRVRDAAKRHGGAVGVAGDSAPFTVGCGVSGYDEDDCLALVRSEIFDGRSLPEIRARVADIDVSTLPEPLQQHLGNPAARGVWFPPLNLRAFVTPSLT